MHQTKKVLNITWRRLVSKGDTCPRCGSTEDELDNAVLKLKEKLKPLGITVILEKTKLTLNEFNQNPLESNRILFNNLSLESLINAKTGQSQCCDACGDSQCRTLELNGKSQEIITADLIIRAGLKAVSK